MKIVHWMLLLLFCLSHLSDARLDFWHGKERKLKSRFNDLNPNKFSPVIFIPGDGGSQVEAKLNKPSTIHYYCEKTADFFNIWLNPKLLVPLVIECWIDNVKLIYDNQTRTTQNMPGVSIRIPGFGRSEVVEWLDPSITKSLAGAYFKDIANALVAKGYVRNVTLRGAPFDFRKAPNENQQWFVDMKQLVEETYELGDQQRVTLLVHSMGGPMSLVFLQQQTKDWKDKYIAQVISLAGAWAGSAKAIKVFAIGDDLGSFALSGSTLRAEQITSPSLAWLMPSPHFWKSNEVLATTHDKQYTMSNLKEFFDDIGYPTGWEMRMDTLQYTDFTAPGVEVHCLYGEGIPTVERLNYKGDLKTTPTLVTGDGDVPGCGGNKMQARLNKADVPHMWCLKNEDYFDIWLNPFEMIPGIIDCWVDNMKLSYDNVTRKTKNTPGVEFRMPQWGRVEDLEWVDATPVINRYDFGAYFYYISEALVDRGYARGYTLFGAPYDFRKGPNENKDWFIRLKGLTEFAYDINENIGITFICHSMGGRMILYFLQQMPQEWKDKYVKQVITLSTPWGGSIQAIQAISVGYDFGAELIQNNKMKQVQETCPAVVWLMPSKNFWKSNEVMVTMNRKNYTLENIDQFFYDIGLPNAVEMRKDLAVFENYTAPGVELHCLYGNNVGDTVDRLEFGAAYNGNPTLVKGNGDGTVNRRSLIGCGHWEKAQSQKIYQQEYQGIEHYNMLSNAAPINYIIGKLTKDNDYPRPDEKVSYSDMMKIRLF